MQSVSGFIFRHKKAVLILVAAAAVVCAVLSVAVPVNYSFRTIFRKRRPKALSVLPFDDAVPNARVMLRDVTIQQALEYKEKLKAIDGVSDVLGWTTRLT